MSRAHINFSIKLDAHQFRKAVKKIKRGMKIGDRKAQRRMIAANRLRHPALIHKGGKP